MKIKITDIDANRDARTLAVLGYAQATNSKANFSLNFDIRNNQFDENNSIAFKGDIKAALQEYFLIDSEYQKHFVNYMSVNV